MSQKLKGIFIPTATPFLESGEIDFAAMEHNLKRWGQTGVAGYMCLGSNGEFHSLSDQESLEVIQVVCKHKGDKTVIAGIGRESLYQTVKMMEAVRESGANPDFFSVLTPAYFAGEMTDDALVDFYRAVADKSHLPILMYIAPRFCNGVKPSGEAIRTLANHPNIVGLKDTSSDMMAEYSDAVKGNENFSMLAGSITNLMDCINRGGLGGVVSAANYFPAECAKITDLFFSGDEAGAVHYCTELRAIISKTAGRFGTSGMKACMNLLGYQALLPRLPLRPLKDEFVAEMRTALLEQGLL